MRPQEIWTWESPAITRRSRLTTLTLLVLVPLLTAGTALRFSLGL